MKRDDETQTEFTIRLIRAEAWDEGAAFGFKVDGGTVADVHAHNPYRVPASAEGPAS